MTFGKMDWRRHLVGTAAGAGLMLGFQYAVSLHRLAGATGTMESEFSRIARGEHLGYLIGQNLYVLLGYLVLWLAAVFLILPAVSVLGTKIPLKRKGSAFLLALGLAFIVHGFFVARLVYSRPYFMTETEFGHWYYRLLDLPPESIRPWVHGALFRVVPWGGLATAVIWWWVQASPRVRWGIALVLAAGGVVIGLGSRGNAPLPEAQLGSGKAPPNVIIIGSDSLRGDRLGYTGYRPQRTDGPAAAGVSPHIDAWVVGAVRFERCYTPIGSTMESGTTVFSSSYPHTHGVRHMFPSREQVEATSSKIRTLADVLAAQGYDTAAIGDWCANYYNQIPLGFREVSVSSFDNFRVYLSQTVLLAHFVVPVYFDNPLGYRLFPQLSSFASFVTPEVVTRRVESKLAEQAASGRPFFWHVFYSSNHLPFRAATEYSRMFTDPDYRGENRDYVAFDIDAFISGTNVEDKLAALDETEVRQIRGLYDGCTREFDACFGRIIAALEKEGLAENTIVVMTSDHGDDLYEPGVTLTHGLGFNGGDHWTHVPLAIAGPGIPVQPVSQQVRTLDIAPTLLGLLGLEAPERWEGRDLAGWLDGGEEPHDLPFYGETSFPYILFRVPGVERPDLPPMDQLTGIDRDYDHHFVVKDEWEDAVISSKQRCLRTRNWKLVATPAKDGSRHYGLFHLAVDPDSRNDLADLRPEVLAPMRTALDRWIDQQAETLIPEIFPDGEPE